MAVSLGKRKNRDESDEESDDIRARLQRAFEAKFKPLKVTERKVTLVQTADRSSVSSESDWDGLSDGEEEQVEVVNHQGHSIERHEEHEFERKTFMSSKPPLSEQPQAQRRIQFTKSQHDEGDDATDAANAKNDLALQRLLKESHLLDPATFDSSTGSGPTGKNRIRALDQRLQDLGSKKSLLKQTKMPMAHRKGIVAKAAGRERTRRREAAENGIVLEKAVKGAGTALPKKRRERSIGGPNVGKFAGGTLRLSARDVRSIEGSKKQLRVGGKKGRR